MLTLEVGHQLGLGLFGSDKEDNSLHSVDHVHFEVDLVSLHLFLQEVKGVDIFPIKAEG
jgi:hypothetical protein